jgi:hypothetical protein
MLDVFATIPRTYRETKLHEYAQYLVERDGDVDLTQRTLSKREPTMLRYETTPASPRALDGGEFSRQYRDFDKRKPPSPEMLLLLALVKVNSAEAYGVEQNFQRVLARASKSHDDLELRILCEETYHTRILLSSANRYGIAVNETYQPPSAFRVMIGGIALSPPSIARPLTLAGEIVATLMFIKLIGITRKVLAHDPETRDAIEERLVEITTDERGHISYNRMLSGPLELAQTRMLLPIVARILSTTLPELLALGAYPTEVLSDIPLLSDSKRLPESIRRESFVA